MKLTISKLKKTTEIKPILSFYLTRSLSLNMSQSFINTFLDSPILTEARDRDLLDYMTWRENKKTRFPSWKVGKFLSWEKSLGDDPPESLDPRYYKLLIEFCPVGDNGPLISQALTLSGELTTLMDASLGKWGMNWTTPRLPGNFSDLPSWSQDALGKMTIFRSFVDTLAYNRASGRSRSADVSLESWRITGDEFTCLIWCGDGQIGYITTFEQILMLKDMLWGRFNVGVGCSLMYPNSTLTSVIGEVFTWGLKCVETYGNNGYDVLKNIESLAKTKLIQRSDPVFGTNGPHEQMLEVSREKERTYSYGATPMIDQLDRLLDCPDGLSEAVELFGLQKLSGHPCVDPRIGGLKVKELAGAKKSYLYSDICRVRNNFCRMYTEGYIRKHKEWPKMRFSKDARKTALFELYTLRRMDIHKSSYPLSDWNGVRFRKHLDMNWYPNFTDLMDDRSISYYRDQASATWDKNILPRSDKRLLLEMLQQEEFSFFRIAEIVRKGVIPFSWLIVSLYPKEREFKVAPRMFAMMVIEMRTFLNGLDNNWAENIFPSLPPQTMTLSKKEITEMFHHMTSDPQGNDTKRFNGEIDLSKWNNQFRSPLYDPIARDAEDMHGEPNLFSVIHHFFAKCVIIVRCHDYEPEFIKMAEIPGVDLEEFQSSLMWIHHDAGIEGISQKPWTAITYSVMDLVLQRYPLSYYLVGQGDNQIYTNVINTAGIENPDAMIRTMAASITKDLDTEFKNVGHALNMDESISSTTVVTYSKDVYINGVEYHTFLKAVSRVFPHSPSDFPSIANSISSISGQCLAAAERCKQPLTVYPLWSFHAAWYLLHLGAHKIQEGAYLSNNFRAKLTNTNIIRLLIVPNDIGGLPILPFTQLIYKGGADPVSKSYASIALMSQVSPISRALLGNLFEGRWIDPNPELSRLLDDPYSLPLRSFTTPEMSILAKGNAVIGQKAKNRAIKELCSLEVETYESELNDALLSVRPLNPIILSDLKGWSIAGVRRTVAKMFTTTRTVQSLLQRKEESNPCSTILSTGINHFSGILARMDSLISLSHKSSSIYKDIEILRSRWKIPDKSTVVGVTSYTPFEKPISFLSSPSSTEGVKVALTSPASFDPHYTRGREDPYLGKETREKRSTHGYKIISYTAAERSIKRLADIMTQPGVGESFKDLVSNIAMSRADVDMRDLEAMVGQVLGGSIIHRYASRLGISGASLLTSVAFASWCIISTDNAPPVSGGSEDFAVMLQEMMVAALGALGHNIIQNPLKRVIVLNLAEYMMQPLGDEPMTAKEGWHINPVILKSNPLAFASTIYMQQLNASYDVPLVGKADSYAELQNGALEACGAIIRRSLTRNGSASAISDLGRGMIRLPFDLLEMRGLGVNSIIQCMSTEIARVCISGLYSRSFTELRWSPLPLIDSLSQAISGPFARSLKHPMFSSEKTVVELYLQDPLTYQTSFRSAQDRLASRISRLAVVQLTNLSSELYTKPLYFFRDESAGSIWKETTSRFQMIIHRSLCYGEISSKDAYRLNSSRLGSLLRIHTLEDQIMSDLSKAAGLLAGYAFTNNLVHLLSGCNALMTGNSVKSFGKPALEIIREARAFSKLEIWVPDLGKSSYPLFLLLPRETCELEASEAENSLNTPAWYLPSTTLRLDVFSANRLRGRQFGLDSSVGYSYTGVSTFAKKRIVTIIGCGHGLGASVLLRSGSLHIYGVDLDSDLDPHAVMNGLDTPSHLLRLGYKDKFTRLPSGQTQADKGLTSSAVLGYRASVGRDCLWVIDIPLTTRESIASIVPSFRATSMKSDIMVRVITTWERLQAFHTYLQVHSRSISVLVVFADDEWVECWIVFVLDPIQVTPSKIERLQKLIVEQLHEYPDLSYLGGGKQYLESSLLDFCDSHDESIWNDIVGRLESLISISMGELEHRFTYRQWTRVLHSLVVLKVLHSDSPMELLIDILGTDAVEVYLGTRTLTVTKTRELARKLSRMCSRLIPLSL